MYWCNCKSVKRKPNGSINGCDHRKMHLTKVNSEDICTNCKHYAMYSKETPQHNGTPKNKNLKSKKWRKNTETDNRLTECTDTYNIIIGG